MKAYGLPRVDDVEHPDKADIIDQGEVMLNQNFYARYKSRTPDPGICLIRTIDWDNKCLSMTNGRYRYFPKFHEVEIVKQKEEKSIDLSPSA